MDVTAVAARALLVTGAVCALGWLVKTALIAGKGGTNTDEGLVALCYLVGLTGWILLGASTGALRVARLTGATSARARVLVVVGGGAGAVLASRSWSRPWAWVRLSTPGRGGWRTNRGCSASASSPAWASRRPAAPYLGPRPR